MAHGYNYTRILYLGHSVLMQYKPELAAGHTWSVCAINLKNLPLNIGLTPTHLVRNPPRPAGLALHEISLGKPQNPPWDVVGTPSITTIREDASGREIVTHDKPPQGIATLSAITQQRPKPTHDYHLWPYHHYGVGLVQCWT